MEILFESNYLGSRVRLYDTWLEHEAFGVRRVVPLNRIVEIYPMNPLVAGVHIEGGPFNGTVGVWGAQKQALVDAIQAAMANVSDETALRVVHVGGFGTMLEQGEEYFAVFGQSELTLSHPWATETLSLRYSDIEGFNIGGPGVMESDAGIIGGGFGLAGAVTGMAVAGLVNEVTRTRSVETGIWWKTRDSEVFLFTDSADPDSLRVELSEQMAKMQSNNGTTARPAVSEAQPQDVVTQLRSLAELHAQGVLNDAEFVAAKQRILT